MITASVSYPFLIPYPADAGSLDSFPTVFAHLLGSNVSWGEIAGFAPTVQLACFALTNPSPQAANVTLSVDLTGYSTPYSQVRTVPAMSSLNTCVSPTPDLNALYGLASRIAGQVHATVTQAGQPILDSVHRVTIETGQTAFNAKWASGNSYYLMLRDQAVFSMPSSPQVQMRLSSVAQWSRWGSFGASGYNMHRAGGQPMGAPDPMRPLPIVVPGDGWWGEPAFFRANESIALRLDSVACASFCLSDTVDFYVMTPSAYQQLTQAHCAGGAPVLINAANSASDAGFVFTAPADGWYDLVFNNCGSAARNVTFTRTGTKADAAIDTLGAIYGYLKAQGITYVNVNRSFFDPASSQTIRWPAQSLTDSAANCVDGSMLFASFAEALALNPNVVYVPGHAYMGILDDPDGGILWPVETTMLGVDTFWGTSTTSGAFIAGINEYYAPDAGTGQACATNRLPPCNLDIKAARGAGVLPIPR